MFQNLLLKNIFSWYILCRDEDIVFLSLQEIHSLPTENSVGNINNSVGN